MKSRPVALVGILGVLITSSCSTTQTLAGVSLSQAAQAVTDMRLGTLPDMTGIDKWEEKQDLDRRGVTFTASTSGVLDLLAPFLTVGTWIICDSHYRISLRETENGVTVSVRRLSHHQVLFVVPVIYSNPEEERSYIAQLERRIQARERR